MPDLELPTARTIGCFVLRESYEPRKASTVLCTPFLLSCQLKFHTASSSMHANYCKTCTRKSADLTTDWLIDFAPRRTPTARL